MFKKVSPDGLWRSSYTLALVHRAWPILGVHCRQHGRAFAASRHWRRARRDAAVAQAM